MANRNVVLLLLLLTFAIAICKASKDHLRSHPLDDANEKSAKPRMSMLGSCIGARCDNNPYCYTIRHVMSCTLNFFLYSNNAGTKETVKNRLSLPYERVVLSAKEVYCTGGIKSLTTQFQINNGQSIEGFGLNLTINPQPPVIKDFARPRDLGKIAGPQIFQRIPLPFVVQVRHVNYSSYQQFCHSIPPCQTKTVSSCCLRQKNTTIWKNYCDIKVQIHRLPYCNYAVLLRRDSGIQPIVDFYMVGKAPGNKEPFSMYAVIRGDQGTDYVKFENPNATQIMTSSQDMLSFTYAPRVFNPVDPYICNIKHPFSKTG